MANAAPLANRLDRDYAAPTIEDFYEPYDFVQVLIVTISADGSGQFAPVAYEDGATGTLRYGLDPPVAGELWLAIRTMRGDSWLEMYVG